MNVNATQLPKPDADSLAHSEKTRDYIVNVINEYGPIPFSVFMDLALYAPGLGYYSVGTQKFGIHGDFVTSPEISPLFSRCVANYCMSLLKEKGEDVFEFGAGTGIMAADILLWLENHDCLPNKYYILELSADLQQRQQETIKEKVPHLFDRVHWLDRIPEKPINAIVLANEVLDAMPVTKFNIKTGEVLEYFVDYQDQQFVWQLEPADDELKKEIGKLNILEVDGFESELNIALPGWFEVVSDMLQHGEVMIIDYGFLQQEYYHPERNMGTLKCHYRHHSLDDPLQFVGIQDVTAHVDFTAVGEAATAAGFEVAHYSNQAKFLLEHGLLDMAKSDHTMEVSQQIKTLTLPTEMGEMFKVMVLKK